LENFGKFSIKELDKLKEKMSEIMKTINFYKQSLIVGNPKIYRLINFKKIKIKFDDNKFDDNKFDDNKFEFITVGKEPSEEEEKNIKNLNYEYKQLRNDNKINKDIRSLFQLLSRLDLIIESSETHGHAELIKILTDIYNRVNELSPKTDGRRSNRRRSNRRRSNRIKSNRIKSNRRRSLLRSKKQSNKFKN
jgi:hypothetical protein